MTIGRNSRMGSVRSSIRAPKFLDKSSGFYGRLDEPEMTREGEETRGKQVEESGNREEEDTSRMSPAVVHSSGVDEREECEATDFTEGPMEDDGERLLRRKPSRRSSRWRRSSRRKQREGREEAHAAREESSGPGLGGHVLVKMEVEELKRLGEENEKTEPGVVHFQVREEADDQVLIRDKKRGREEEEEEEKRMKREQEEGMKMVKRKNYRKALDRAFRRGWEAFITNLYSVTLTPVTPPPQSPSSPASKKKLEHSRVLAELR